MTSIDQHPRKPELHLLAESGEKPYPRSLPRVTVIKVHAFNIYPYVEGHPPPRQNHDFLKFITSCPNLKSCSWVVRNPNKSIIHQTLDDFEEFDTQTLFPDLEQLALDGHYIGSQMWRDWQDHFSWSSLSSLEIGPQLFALENLKLLTGRLMNLKCLKITGSDIQNEDLDRSLESFLISFDTLVNLELLNCSVPLEAISRHTRLSSLCVHIGETWNCLDSRVVYGNIDIVSLDALCPLLETLELDIERDSFKEEWVCFHPELLQKNKRLIKAKASRCSGLLGPWIFKAQNTGTPFTSWEFDVAQSSYVLETATLERTQSFL